MISENYKSKYQSIKAPESLKKRIADDMHTLQTESKIDQNTQGNASPKKQNSDSSFQIKKIVSAIAACIMVVFVVGFVGMGMNSSTVYLNGDIFFGEEIQLSPTYSSASVQRSMVEKKHVEINCILETTLYLENGEFTLFSSETGEEIYTGNEYSVKGKVIVKMNLPDGEKAVLRLQNMLSEREITFNTNTL